LRTALFWVITQRVVFRNYHYLLRNNPEECSSHPPRGRSLQSHISLLVPVARRNTSTT